MSPTVDFLFNSCGAVACQAFSLPYSCLNGLFPGDTSLFIVVLCTLVHCLACVCSQGGGGKTNGPVSCVSFDRNGEVVWAGDAKVCPLCRVVNDLTITLGSVLLLRKAGRL